MFLKMNYKEKTFRVFNKFFSSFLKDLKEVDEDLRKLVKESYKAIDKSSSEYCIAFADHMISSSENSLAKLISGTYDEEVRDKELCKNIKFGVVLDKIESKDQVRVVILNYIYTLTLFAYLNILEDEDELFSQVVTALSHVQAKKYEEFDKEKDDILDDDVKGLLEKIKEYEVSPKVDIEKEIPSGGGIDPDLISALGNSKIADLAKEISKDIDVSALKADNPDELMKNMLNFNGENNVLGNIIQKVSSTLNDKITKGEIKHEELLGEAMTMMNMFNGGNSPFAGNPLFAQMMKSMKTGKTNVRQDVLKKHDTRDRLRKKLEAKKKNVE